MKTQKTKLKIKLFLGVFFLSLLASPKKALAQEISLSLYPPLIEITLQPGKELLYPFLVSNQGIPQILKFYLLSFEKGDIFGNPQGFGEKIPDWINIIKPENEVFLENGQTQELVIRFNPPKDTQEKDYYLTLIAETSPLLTSDQNQVQNKVKIGANILISISKSGITEKTARIKEFKAPHIIDSFFPLKYEVIIQNTGESFFKPNGKIVIHSSLGKEKVLSLASQNVISNSERKIFCVENENITDCTLPGFFHLGIYKAKLEFSLDETGKIYKSETTTIAFPFFLLFPLLFATSLLLILRKERVELPLTKK